MTVKTAVKSAEDAKMYTAGCAAALEEVCSIFDKVLTHGHPPQRIVNLMYDICHQKYGNAIRNHELWQ